jgi:hypothetical protein
MEEILKTLLRNLNELMGDVQRTQLELLKEIERFTAGNFSSFMLI